MQEDHSESQFSQQQEVAAIALSLRVPPFWRDKPRLWFISFEAATSDLKKSQAQLAQMVIAQLDKLDIEQISDLLYSPPETDQYNALKKRLIAVYEESDNQQFQKLLSDMELGDQKPSQLLRRMRSLARDKVPDSTLRLMWTNHLPAHVRSVLAVSETLKTQTALDELALLADKMIENSSSNSQIAAVSTGATTLRTQGETQFLIEEIRRLSLEVSALKSAQQYNQPQHHQQQNQPYFRRNRSMDRNNDAYRKSRSKSPSPYCYYHRRFGKDARRCTTPCSYKTANSEN